MKTNLKKKLCAAALSALMLTGAGVFQAVPVMFVGMPVYAQTAETPESSFSYTINNSREVFIMNYKGTDANVVVPAKIQNKPVTRICSGSFKDNTSLVSVVLPDTVKTIEGSSFKGCTNLSSISVADSVEEIGSNAFADTAWYNSQPEGAVYIAKMYYRYKGKLPENSSVIIKNGTKGIAKEAFYNQTGLVNVTLPEGIYSIDSWAFENCTSLSKLYMPESVKSFGYEMFKGCEKLVIHGKKGSSAEFYANTYKIAFSAEPVELVNTSEMSKTAISRGGKVTITAGAVGGTGIYEYAYVVFAPDGKWYVLKNYSTADSHTFTPAQTGKYVVQVKTKDSSGTVKVKSFTLNVAAALLNDSEISAESINRGESVTVTAAASGGVGPYEYAFVTQAPDGKWYVLKNYSKDNIHKFTPAQSGKYTVQVKARDESGTVKIKSFTLEVAKGITNTSTISAESLKSGDSVTLQASAADAKGKCEFAYVTQGPDGKWYVLKNYSTTASYKFTPSQLGRYKIQIKARDESGVVAIKTFTLEVEQGLMNTSTASSMSAMVGDTIIFKASGKYGTGLYQYAYVYCGLDGVWKVLRDYSSASSYRFTQKEAGKYVVQVKVKDTSGSVRVKSFVVYFDDEAR